MSLRFLPLRQQAFRGLTTAPSAGPARRRPTTPSPAPGREVLAAPRAPGEPSPALLSPTQRPPRGALPQRCSLKGAHRGESYLQLLVRVLLWVLAALALLPQLLQLGLALVQCVALAPLLRLVLLQRGLRGKDHRATAEPTALPAPAQRQPGLRAPAKPRRGGQSPPRPCPPTPPPAGAPPGNSGHTPHRLRPLGPLWPWGEVTAQGQDPKASRSDAESVQALQGAGTGLCRPRHGQRRAMGARELCTWGVGRAGFPHARRSVPGRLAWAGLREPAGWEAGGELPARETWGRGERRGGPTGAVLTLRYRASSSTFCSSCVSSSLWKDFSWTQREHVRAVSTTQAGTGGVGWGEAPRRG